MLWQVEEESTVERDFIPTKLLHKDSFRGHKFRDDVTLPDNTHAILRSSCTLTDTKTAFDILNHAVQLGDGFALDEFPTLELFQKYFLSGRQLILLQDDDHHIKAVAVVGSSLLCRSSGSSCSTLYMYVVPQWRNKGYGTYLNEYVEGYLLKQGYTSIITDVFMSKDFPHKFLRKCGLIPTGILPMSGIIKEQGLTDCAIYHKYINLVSNL